MDIDMERIKKQIAEDNRKRRAALRDKRATMLETLAAAGIKKVTGSYEGYGDSGNSEVTELEPDGKTLSDKDKEDLKDLIWGFAYDQSPGFEINEGGNGTFKWDISTDRIDINHVMILEEHQSYENI